MKKIGDSTSSFEALINSNAIYVDKTNYLYNLVKNEKISNCYFISRPRRFGKSLMCSTLGALFSGRKELFEGLAISKTDYEFKKYPVLRFDFSKFNTSSYESFISDFERTVKTVSEEVGVKAIDSLPSSILDNLLGQIKDAVIIIDEFDSSIIDAIASGNIDTAEKMRAQFNAFYKVIKSYSGNIRFFFITGVTKLSGLNIFSSMNNLKDLTLHPEYATMFGYTEEDLGAYFSEYIDECISKEERNYKTKEEFIESLRSFYDGYRFSPDVDLKVYNPVSINSYFSNKPSEFKNYWIDTGGAATLTVTLAKTTNLIFLANDSYEMNIDALSCFDIAQIAEEADSDSVVAMLYYSGYLTTIAYKSGTLSLSFPNEEVKRTFLRRLVKTYVKPDRNLESVISTLRGATNAGDIPSLIATINKCLETFNIDKKLLSEYSHNLAEAFCYSLFSLASLYTFLEPKAGYGKADLIVLGDSSNYIIELKAKGETARDGMKQIADRKYSWGIIKDKPIHLLSLEYNAEYNQIVKYEDQIYGEDKIEAVTVIDTETTPSGRPASYYK